MTKSSVQSFFNNAFLILLFILVVGTPLVFTPLTRSVFEVNKLLLLRVIILLTCFLGFLRTALLQDSNNVSDENSISILGYTWKKTGLEIPMALWFLLNVVSTVFSQNIRISIFGAYDRWEGIITLIGYMLLIFMFAKLVTKRYQLYWLLGGLIGSTFFSAWYGIFQSIGYDFMHWSKDPTFRVFACINNPVHYCPYVAMIVPIGCALLLYLSSKHHVEKEQPKPYVVLGVILSVGLIGIYSYSFDSFSILFGQMSIVLLIAYLLCVQTTSAVPTKEDIIYWLGYGVLVTALILLEAIPFNKDQWLGYAIVLVTMIVVGPYKNPSTVLKRLIFVSTGVIFYTQVLSFSRAAWVGFLMSMPILFLYMSNKFSLASEKSFIKDVCYTFIGTFVLTLMFIFKFHTVQAYTPLQISKYLIFAALCYYFVVTPILAQFKENDLKFKTHWTQMVGVLVSFWVLFIIRAKTLGSLEITIKLACLLLLLWLSTKRISEVSLLISRLSIIFCFLFLQYAGQSVLNFTIYLGLVILFYLNGVLTMESNKEGKFWLLIQLLSFGMIMSIPTIPLFREKTKSLILTLPSPILISSITLLIIFVSYSLLVTLNLSHRKKQIQALSLISIIVLTSFSLWIKNQQVEVIEGKKIGGLRVARNIASRSNLYEHELERSARVSMWKSAIPWVRDHLFIGSGPDTIKYMYPVYRRPEYGKMEGGHNYTPDRLHNEYLNTMATRGIIGFLIYYVGIILGWVFIVLKGAFRYRHSKLTFITISLLTSGLIFLGQVLFNFGVVATLVLFYISLGLSLALSNHESFYEKDTSNE